MTPIRTTFALRDLPVGQFVQDSTGHLWAKFHNQMWICEHAEKWTPEALLFDAEGNEVTVRQPGPTPFTHRSPSGWELLDQIDREGTDA